MVFTNLNLIDKISNELRATFKGEICISRNRKQNLEQNNKKHTKKLIILIYRWKNIRCYYYQ